MADMKTTTRTCLLDLGILEEVLTRAEFAHSLAALITESADFKKLSVHQQNALMALTVFTCDVKDAISELMKVEN
ncbi:hypothetical protein CM24_005166 [Salmonella enterica subsp. enterica]|uniref:Uncharacterized protein n=1 Tax=Salmonella diarizonae TaxID=59204 RepID=A0A702DBR9_SALDZ|nr:hypothetical protein [Salmonella enterica subsp. enterica serovar Bareilly]EFI4978991.1 hypothetical protein [Salmonella enterica]EKR1798958.1 hypothetical protein [Salmonella enterica subsp. diarizonae serovar 65:z10:e,n,x,z15]HAC6767586.1 hypothetical protein [Salmonella enterica subsp. diarizonae]HCM6306890.1 hypothetical protein [Salmonella enterica subsp. enterica serovar 6,14:y:1,7]